MSQKLHSWNSTQVFKICMGAHKIQKSIINFQFGKDPRNSTNNLNFLGIPSHSKTGQKQNGTKENSMSNFAHPSYFWEQPKLSQHTAWSEDVAGLWVIRLDHISWGCWFLSRCHSCWNYLLWWFVHVIHCRVLAFRRYENTSLWLVVMLPSRMEQVRV